MMVYTIRNDKNAFFNVTQPWTLKSVDDYVRSARVLDDKTSFNQYSFVLKNYIDLETEFKNLFKEFESLKEDEEQKDIFWFFCYYRCRQLILFYGTDKPGEEGYHKPSEVEKYEAFAAKLKDYFEPCDIVSLTELPDIANSQVWPIVSNSAYVMVNGELYFVIKGSESEKGSVRKVNMTPLKYREFNQ